MGNKKGKGEKYGTIEFESNVKQQWIGYVKLVIGFQSFMV